jgi:hypothetical protein
MRDQENWKRKEDGRGESGTQEIRKTEGRRAEVGMVDVEIRKTGIEVPSPSDVHLWLTIPSSALFVFFAVKSSGESKRLRVPLRRFVC